MVRLSMGGASPKAPADALMELLLALGTPLGDIPPSIEARRARYVAMLGGRRPLILLDDAVAAEQVLPLLPPSGGMVIVTSRRDLPELLAEGARVIPLKPLTTLQALQLLAQRIGWARVRPELLAARQIVEACGRIPLAVVMAASRIAATSEEEVPLRRFSERLQYARRRLVHLGIGRRSVEAALNGSLEPSIEAGQASLPDSAVPMGSGTEQSVTRQRRLARRPGARSDDVRVDGRRTWRGFAEGLGSVLDLAGDSVLGRTAEEEAELSVDEQLRALYARLGPPSAAQPGSSEGEGTSRDSQ